MLFVKVGKRLVKDGSVSMGNEKSYEKKIKKYLDDHKAWYVKYFANEFTKAGIPDILACVNGYFVGIEVKAQNGKPTELQLYHCKRIREAGGLAFVVYPSGFDRLKAVIINLLDDRWPDDVGIILK